MNDPRELFLHELGDILYAERTLVKALPKLAQEATESSLATAFEKHLGETERHVTNIEKAFETVGETAKAEKCPGIEGIKKEHDEFVTTRSRARTCSTCSSPAPLRAPSTTRSRPTPA